MAISVMFMSLTIRLQEVRSHREEISAGESRLFYLNSMKTLMENQSQKMADEMKAYMSSDPQERKKSFRYE